ncbi:hypothetical protein [Pseudoalteromonas ruthenica]|uniref:hypothetical protein n=1 Tax=Pseudoalteromonas ruthenica TaxID=151081 RepID=UPI00241CC8FD|nr:hypothetical protein [Pseudoalteromonas ruthenica]
MIQMNTDEFFDFYVCTFLKLGFSRLDIADLFGKSAELGNLTKEQRDTAYEYIKSGIQQAPLLSDIKTLKGMLQDIMSKARILSKYQVKRYGGSISVVMKGNSRFGPFLAGTLYMAKNPKVFNIAVGTQAARGALRSGFVMTLVLSPAIRGFEQLMYDNLTWHHFVVGVAVDYAIALASIATAAGLAFGGTAIIGASAAAAIPMAVIVLVGLAFSWFTNVVFSDQIEKFIDDTAKTLAKNEEELFWRLRNKSIILKIDNTPDGYEKFIHNLLAVPNISGIFENKIY